MPDIPDYTFKQNFPIASIVDAAQRKAQMEQQNTNQGNQQLLAGLQSIGEIGKSLVDKRLKVAQALALGRQFGVPDDQARAIGDPDLVLRAAAVNKNQIDANMWAEGMKKIFGGTPHGIPQPGSMPAAVQNAAPSANGAMLTGGVPTTTPMPSAPAPGGVDQSSSTAPSQPAAPAPVPVPIAAPPAMPKMINKATADMIMKAAMANRQVPVMTQADALTAGTVPKGSIIEKPAAGAGGDVSPAAQDKLEGQYRNLLTKNISMRSGGLGLEDSKVNQAIHLRRLVNQSYDPTTGNFNIPKSYYGELVNGLATLTSPNGRPGIEVIHELQQRTAKGDIGGALAYLGVTDQNGNLLAGSTQSVFKTLVDSIDRQGDQAEQNRQGYLDQIHGLAPTQLSEDRIQKMNQANIGNSFNSFLTKSPDKQTQGSGSLTAPYGDAEKEKRYQAYLAKRHI